MNIMTEVAWKRYLSFLILTLICSLTIKGAEDDYRTKNASSNPAMKSSFQSGITINKSKNERPDENSVSHSFDFTEDDEKKENKVQTVTSLEQPDFAFPQTVSADALTIYNKALKEKNPVTALQAAMAMNVADACFTNDSILISLDRYDRLAKVLRRPYSALAKLLKAQLLSDIYCSASEIYDSRTLPIEDLNADPKLWSGDQFKKVIYELCENILHSRNQLVALPIGKIAPLITNAAASEDAGMTAYDFACYQICRILEKIDLQQISSASVGSEERAIPFLILSEVEGDEKQDETIDLSENSNK